ncbi:nacht and ankyrin domain protein [Colletotrichum incanum]|uniref:Nacht and ankyrin domain protein n=1 Tax=Colletotrichum incanum TaxID=1573173 RepID=A0A167DL39_COLIC|nr:nacht and ankyrin domain protein [Colletotrichum incanum]
MESFISNPDLAHVQVITMSRPEVEFIRTFRDWINETNCISLNKKLINANIRSYIGIRIKQSKKLKKKMDFNTVRNTKDPGQSRSFRWAACQLDRLETCLDREALEAALRSLPLGLDAKYTRILENIPQERQKKAIRLLQFLVHAQSPLSIQAAVDVIAVRLDGSFDPDDRLLNQQILREHPNATGDYRVLQLAHFSVKEYLLRPGAKLFHKVEASISIIQTFLSYLTCVEKAYCHEEEPPHRFPLAAWAVCEWMNHAQPAEASKETVTTIVDFLQNPKTFQLWNSLAIKYQISPSPYLASPLEWACLMGLVSTAGKILSDASDFDAPVLLNASPLIASWQGHKEIIQILLDKGANANTQSGEFRTALYAASFSGHKEIVQKLLDKGANFNAQSGEFGTALCAASYIGHREIVQILLNQGAEVDTQSGELSTALKAASERGHKEIVQTLLEKGASIQLHSSDGLSILDVASRRGHTEVVELLLEKRADVAAMDELGETLLYKASQWGHKQVVKLLLEKGANVGTTTATGMTPLHAASLGGHVEAVKLFLETGNANAKHRMNASPEDDIGRTPLFLASFSGYMTVVNTLLTQHPTTSDWKDHYGPTPLSAAARKDYTEFVQSFLTKEFVDINSRDCFGRTPLWWATRNGYEEVSRLLTESGKERGLSLDGIEKAIEVKMRPEMDSEDGYCDICLSSVFMTGDFYYCSVCMRGGFAICLDFFTLGGHCLEESHERIRIGEGK